MSQLHFRAPVCGSKASREPNACTRSPRHGFQNTFLTDRVTTESQLIPNLRMNLQTKPTIADASQATQEASLLTSDLTSGRLLARNTLWSIASLAAPLLVALVAVPILIHSIGLDRFGVLSVAWMLIGYFSLFDFGIDQGLTKMVADRLATGEKQSIPPLVWSSLALLLLFGMIA